MFLQEEQVQVSQGVSRKAWFLTQSVVTSNPLIYGYSHRTLTNVGIIDKKKKKKEIIYSEFD